MTEELQFTPYESTDCGEIIFEFVDHEIQENKREPSDIAIGLLNAYLAILSNYAEAEYISSVIQEGCDYLKRVRVTKDGKIYIGGEIH